MTHYKEVKKNQAKTQVVIARLTEDDLSSMEAPDKLDEGFWPSLDVNAPGYIGAGNEHDYNNQMDAARRRMKGFELGTWNYIGVRAVALITIKISENDVCEYRIKSAGVWGVESDCGEEYLNETFTQQAEELKAHIEALAAAPVTIAFNMPNQPI